MTAALAAELARVTVDRPMMGGRVLVHAQDAVAAPALEADAVRVLDRLAAWASILTRFTDTSELARLNADPRGEVPVGPTLTAVLDWARAAEARTDGLVDIAMLDARLAAEAGEDPALPSRASRRWSLRRSARGAAVVRNPGVRFDLDGVAKGWLADRALELTPGRTALVDADGDISARLAPGDELLVEVADPRPGDAPLATLRLTAGPVWRRVGLATSGTSVHRWQHADTVAHHLIDPATGRPAVTDLVQVSVLAGSARDAEVLAKAALIAGADAAPMLLDRPGVLGALMLTTRGEIRATTGMLEWLV